MVYGVSAVPTCHRLLANGVSKYMLRAEGGGRRQEEGEDIKVDEEVRERRRTRRKR